jgi:SNF2 family DNA or RNA helicase
MKYKPHDYQDYATDFVLSHTVSGLILDMGLGKSVITLTALWDLILDSFDVGRVLVIAPKRVAEDTWPKELAKWDHLKGLTYSLVLGSEKQRREALKKRAFIYIINRENVTWLVSNYRWDFDTLVIDELSSFKSAKAQRFKALKRGRPLVKRVIGLTGTPAPNSLIDLWPEIFLLDMGQRLGRFIGGFRDRFFLPDKRNREIIYSYKPREGAEEAIYRLISDICISMKATDHLQMPELISSRVDVRMTDAEKSLYDKFKQDMVLKLPEGELDAVNAAALSGKLLQMANGAVYGDERKVLTIHDRKLDALEDIIEAANGKPLLVAYWFNHDRDRIMARFPGARLINTSADIDAWCAGEIPVALIHPASAGHGLNLQDGGSTIVWFV